MVERGGCRRQAYRGRRRQTGMEREREKGVEEKRSLNRALEDRMGGEVKKEKQSGGQG